MKVASLPVTKSVIEPWKVLPSARPEVSAVTVRVWGPNEVEPDPGVTLSQGVDGDTAAVKESPVDPLLVTDMVELRPE
ncbi:MAG TPA: hypothetical protein VGF59_29370, partial [Bryobacteraceae bacterium]